MKNKKVLILLMLTLCMIITLTFSAFFSASAVTTKPVDVGNYNDYGSYDGGYDYGGGNDYSYSGGSNYSSGSSGSSTFSGPIETVAVIIVIVVIVIVAIAKGKGVKGSSVGGAKPLQVQKPQNHQGEIIMAIQHIDPNFSDTKFIAFAKQTFITLQQAWTARDWSIIRPLEKEELYEQHQRQLQEYINLKRINIIERINVGDTYMHLYKRDNQYEYLTVYMSTRMVDYIIDENSRQVLKGNPNQDSHIDYLLTFMRKTGVKTQDAVSTASSKTCPNCGAPIKVNSAGKCEYCGSIITTGDFDWVLSDMDALRPGLNINNAGVIITDTNMDNNGGSTTPMS
ncbi:MAG TPA: TIM44-like domain-containing protein [Clostridiales bacterium]|nr:TIM44-like domain-containing protein [Clostridiales bacterium]